MWRENSFMVKKITRWVEFVLYTHSNQKNINEPIMLHFNFGSNDYTTRPY